MCRRAGLGIVMAPQVTLRNDLIEGRLVPLLTGFTAPPRPMHLMYHRDRTPTPKFKTFVDFIIERFGSSTSAESKAGAAAAG
jgi:DNA-binding transcriptional LysR family regulator